MWNLWMSKRWPPCDAGSTEEGRRQEGSHQAGHGATHNCTPASFAAKRDPELKIANACKKPRNSREGIGLHGGEAPTQAAEGRRETPRPPRSVRHSKEADKEDAAAPDPPRVKSALVRAYMNGQELLGLLDTGCGGGAEMQPASTLFGSISTALVR